MTDAESAGQDLSAAELTRLTSDFYAQVHQSFSATRGHAWPGWERVLDTVGPVLATARSTALLRSSAPSSPMQVPRVLDLACGNLRFERFLASEGLFPEVWAVDNCDALVPNDHGAAIRFLHRDLALPHEDLLAEVPACDLVVCFAFMHHLPTEQQRANLLRYMAKATRPDGYISLSFWQFERDERLLAKARPLAGTGDYLLGWQNEPGVARYCHSFTEDEIDALVGSVSTETNAPAREILRFSADGKRGDLNRYVILQRRSVPRFAQKEPDPFGRIGLSDPL